MSPIPNSAATCPLAPTFDVVTVEKVVAGLKNDGSSAPLDVVGDGKWRAPRVAQMACWRLAARRLASSSSTSGVPSA